MFKRLRNSLEFPLEIDNVLILTSSDSLKIEIDV